MTPAKTCVSLFAGGGLKTLGAMQAGYKPVLSVEYDPDIAEVYARNFHGSNSLRCADVREVDYRPFAGADLLMASPVCTRASLANKNRGESDLDVSCAEAVCRALREIRPHTFLLENVMQYRDFDAYKRICDTLDALGYWCNAQVLNAADFGVPQSRKRLIVRATDSGYLPPLPTPTPRLGWYDAIADLLPTCPESALAPWQLKRLPKDFPQSHFYVSGTEMRQEGEAFIVPCGRPARTVKASEEVGRLKAVLVEGDAAGARPPLVLDVDVPAFTLKTAGGGRVHRAVLFSDQTDGDFGVSMRSDKDPAQTVVVGNARKHIRAVTLADCRVVSLTPRCLARFQTIPDSYLLPESRTLAAKIIGNAVPCEMVRRLLESMTT